MKRKGFSVATEHTDLTGLRKPLSLVESDVGPKSSIAAKSPTPTNSQLTAEEEEFISERLADLGYFE